MMLFAMAPAGPDEGLAWLIGLLIAAFIGVLAIGGHQWWMDQHGPSPTPPWARPKALTPGETDDTDPDDTDFDTVLEGRRIITLADGQRVVRYFSLGPAEDEREEDEPVDEDEPEETRDEMADRLVPLIEAERCRYSDAVREIMNAFDVSESTAKRDLAKASERIADRR
jgi:hypothetical protein